MTADWRSRVFSFNTHNRAAWVAAEAARLPPGSRVLDIGAGTGPYRQCFVHCDYRTHDFGQEPSTVGRYAPLDYESDITAIPAPDAAFDAILCTEVLEHVPDPSGAIREMARLVRPGGTVLLTAPLGSHLHQEPYHFFGGYTPYWYRHVLTAHGLEIRSLERNQGFFSFFGQEAQRFHQLLAPAHTARVPFATRVALTALWVGSFPFSRLLPMLGVWLDTLALEAIATIGYHVVAIRKPDVR